MSRSDQLVPLLRDVEEDQKKHEADLPVANMLEETPMLERLVLYANRRASLYPHEGDVALKRRDFKIYTACSRYRKLVRYLQNLRT